MSKKLKLKEIHAKLKSWAESSGDEVLDNHLKELEDEINTSGDEEEEDEGGNHPETPDVP
jgi:hypothetical protein